MKGIVALFVGAIVWLFSVIFVGKLAESLLANKGGAGWPVYAIICFAVAVPIGAVLFHLHERHNWFKY